MNVTAAACFFLLAEVSQPASLYPVVLIQWPLLQKVPYLSKKERNTNECQRLLSLPGVLSTRNLIIVSDQVNVRRMCAQL